MKYTLVFTLRGALSDAVAVEWTDQDAPAGSGAGWEPCLRRADGTWRLSSVDPVAAPRHRRDPGLFANIGLRYRLEATGPWSEASASRKEIVILDMTEEPDPDTGGGDGGGEPPAPPAAPLLITAPVLAGAGTIGTPVSADPGLWTSATTPDFAYLWLRDGTAIAGATGAVYVPGPEDDLSDLAVRVTATNAGGATEAVSAALRVTYAAPVARGALFDEIFDAGSGEQIVETAGEFAGENLRFALEATGGLAATIEPATGLLRIATDAPLSGAEIAVTASNSGGSARSAFLVTIEAADGPGDLPAPLAAEDWTIAAVVEVSSGQYTAEIEVAAGSPADGAVALYWSNWVNRYQEVPFEMAPLGGRRWRMTGIVGGSATEWHLKAPGETLDNLMLRYQPVAGGPVSDNSADAKSWQAPVAEAPREPVETGRPAPVALRSSIDMGDGVVWTFTKPVPCGQYWNGDWFVHNPAGAGGFAITSVTPDSVKRASGSNASFSSARMHGLMRDPIINRVDFKDRSGQGFDEAGEGRLNGNWMGRHTTYDESLNVNPNLKGNIVFSAGQEGSLYKALSMTVPDNTSRSCFRKFFILTVVREIPPEGAFRPSPDRDVKSKAAIATIAQLDAVSHPLVTLDHPVQYSVSQVQRYLTGPFMSPALGARPNSSLYGRDQTFEKNDPLYNAVFGQAVNAAHAHVMDSRTSAADRREIMAKMVQIGLDVMQAGAHFDRFEYSPAHSFSAFVGLVDFAATVVDNAAVRATYDKCVANDLFHERILKQGRDPSENGGNPGTGTKTSLRFIDETDMWFRTPPEGTQSDVNWNKPIQTPFIPDQEYGEPGPYTGGHIGMPFRTGSGSPNGGYHSNMNMSYTRLGWINTPCQGLVACYDSPTRNGVDVANPILCAVMDRYARYFQGHHDGKWSLEGTPQFVDKNWTIWDAYLLDLYNKTRPAYVADVPVWKGRPEQPFPPLVSKPGAGQLRIQFLDVRVSNDGPLTGAQYRIRRVKSSNVSGSWQQNAELRERVFYNTPKTPWGNPVDVAADVKTVTLDGLASGIWQVQWRLKNARGWGPWSTNCGWAGDERASAGLPAGPRAVILI